MTVLDLLKAARASLTEYTWGQGVPAGCLVPDGKECAGTIIERLQGNATERSTVDAAMDAVRTEMGIGSRNAIPDWNDTPGRTLAEMHAAFDAAIAKLESGASAE
jgi:hypothetical protein